MPAIDIVIELTCPPYQNTRPSAALDLLLGLSAFDLKLALVFQGHGILHLQPDLIAPKDLPNYHKTFAALPWYDINHCYTDQQTLNTHNLLVSELTLATTILTPDELATLRQNSKGWWQF